MYLLVDHGIENYTLIVLLIYLVFKPVINHVYILWYTVHAEIYAG